MLDFNDPAVIARIRRDSDLATAMLTMVHVTVGLRGVSIKDSMHFYLFPDSCLDDLRPFLALDPEFISISGRGSYNLHYFNFKPVKARRATGPFNRIC